MNLNRRQFAVSGLATLAFSGLPQRALAQGETYRNEVAGYGPLLPDREGLLDLPRGFTYRVISRAGEAMDDGFIVPDSFDGMCCIPLGRGRVALVRNHELGSKDIGEGPAGGDPAREARLAAMPVYGRDAQGRVMPGGTTTLVYNLRTHRREAQYLSLAGTSTNCAGGVTPWGSWLSCEETVIASPDAQRSHGWVFEVPARQRGLADPAPIKAMGRFRHEAAAVDPLTGIVYLTEDRDDGLFYRFLPNVRDRLAQGGRLQALGFADGGRDSRNWHGADFLPGARRALRWIDLADVESPGDDLRQRGHAQGAVLFARGEGIHPGVGGSGHSEFYFTCTSGGAGRYGQIMRLMTGPQADSEGELQLFVESADPALMDYADNITVAPWGHLVVCEDRKGHLTNHLRGVTREGGLYAIARLRADTELAGACFSPGGSTLFVNAHAPGRTLAISGPWGRLTKAPARR